MVCGRTFRATGIEKTCSADCREVARIGRRYLSEDTRAKQRRYNATSILRHPEKRRPCEITWAKAILADDPGANRRYIVSGSRIRELLIKVGRTDLLPTSSSKPGR
jgi:hypothetical protein